MRALLLALLIATPALAAPAEVLAPPAGTPPRATILYLSGDAGWGPSMARKSARILAAGGYLVVGLDSLAQFSSTSAPPATARWIAAAAADPRVPRTGPLILAGQSFGADQVAAALPHLPPEVTRRLVGLALTVPGDSRYDKVGIGEFLGTSPGIDNRALVTAAAARLPTLCIHGADEDDTPCPTLQGPAVTRVSLPGGHMLRRDSDTLGRTILAWARKVAP